MISATMGYGAKFWELLKSQGRDQGSDFLRNKRVAVDLSYWVVLHEQSSINKYKGVQNLHITLTFIRTIELFSRLGAYPVFVVDGTLLPLKAKARMARYFRSCGVDVSSLPEGDDERYLVQAYEKFIDECVFLLELLGMPVLRAKGDALALCAQLNREQRVVACITDDFDAFLYGAETVIKRIHLKSKPFECYQISDVDIGLGLKREHLIAVALSVGSDCDVNELKDAISIVKMFRQDEILKMLDETASEPLPIQMYIRDHHEKIGDLGWGSPKTQFLVAYLASRLRWEPSYIWDSLFPMLTTIDMRSQYEFHSIQPVLRSHGVYEILVEWKRSRSQLNEAANNIREDDIHHLDSPPDENMDRYWKANELKEAVKLQEKKPKVGDSEERTPQNSGIDASPNLLGENTKKFYLYADLRAKKLAGNGSSFKPVGPPPGRLVLSRNTAT